ncbi:hypothetical protein [Mycobacterium asiaticum]|uniref:hypothetical protein n=1 Tax=Mycobacterium asiaticum TaxID=1790 RepID=UPI00055C9274|nr:hypothetical protein [Mycobacterium asiaticum]ORA18711.1 hypothetical protein BST16_00660 [Mycobacterium asiaticum DSM 44297]
MADRAVLELRIHGINNTTPESMLDLPGEDVEKFAGDALGSFWRPKSPEANPPTQLEAYSWGGMARSSVGGAMGIGRIVGAIARIGWALLIPFGLVNVAYWSRKFDDGPEPDQRPGRDGWRHGRGAASLRIAGLMLTLLLAVSATTIALDLIGVQCYDGNSTRLCTNLPSQLDFLGDLTQSRRLAVLSMVPVLLILGLAMLSTVTRVRYEQPDPSTPEDSLKKPEASEVTEPQWPILSTQGFWAHRESTKVTSRMHVAATATLIATGTAFHVAFGRGESCGSRDRFFSAACRQEVLHGDGTVIAELVVVAIGIAILVFTFTSVGFRSDYAVDVPRQSSRRLLLDWGPVVAGAVLFVVQAALLWRDQPDPKPRQLLGVAFTPTLLLAALLGLALAALLWRPSVKAAWHGLPSGLGLCFVALVVISGYANGIRWWFPVWLGAAAVALGVLLAVRRMVAQKCKHEAWNGGGPGVLLLTAAAFAMLLSSAVVTATGDWLNGKNSASRLADGVSGSAPDLQVPLPYVWAGASVIPVIVGMFAVGTYAFAKSWRGRKALEDRQPMTANAAGFAAFAQRAEKFVAALAVLSAIAMTVTLVASVRAFTPRGLGSSWLAVVLDRLLSIGMWALAGTGVLVIGLAVGGTAVGGRPLGLVWDLICFLPRTGHPLAPPCYAERVVPELAARCADWFTKERGERAVLSAHSLGSVLAVAVILSPRLDGHRDRVAFLSYGSQLRTYFGRIFPELLGPKVLGCPPCLAADLRTRDPWARERSAEREPAPVPHRRSVYGSLGPGPRWRSLWRRTDYLGFPVWSYAEEENPIDQVAERVVKVGYLYEIQTHSGYPRTGQYQNALTELSGIANGPRPSADPSSARAPQ